MIVPDGWVVVLYMEISFMVVVGVIVLVYGLQLIYAWVHDEAVGSNMLIQSAMATLNHKHIPTTGKYVMKGDVDAIPRDGTLGVGLMCWIAVLLPPIINYYIITLIVCGVIGLLFTWRFCIRITKHIHILRHTAPEHIKNELDIDE